MPSNVQRTDYGLKVTLSGFMEADDMEVFRLQVREHLEDIANNPGAQVFADLRKLHPLPTASQLAIVVLNRRALELGVSKVFVVHSWDETRLQFEKLAKMGAAQGLERHVDATRVPGWENEMRRWFSEKATPKN